MSDIISEEFVDEYCLDDRTVFKYQLLERYSRSVEEMLYVGSLFIAIIIYMILVVTESVLDAKIVTTEFQVGVVLISIGLSSFLYYIFKSNKEKIGLTKEEILRHYVAKAIKYHSGNTDPQKTQNALEELSDYMNKQSVSIIHQNRQEEFERYVQALDDFEGKSLESEINKTLPDNIEIIVNELREHENREKLAMPERDEISTNNPSQILILAESVIDEITYARAQIITAFAVIVLAYIAWSVSGTEVAAVVLGTYPVLQAVLAATGRNSEEN
jgi:hypothetical protein